ncbi:MAG: mechanosensitive ion channel domain-containing protein [Cyanobacteria bacterium P01_F01_bin.150]
MVGPLLRSHTCQRLMSCGIGIFLFMLLSGLRIPASEMGSYPAQTASSRVPSNMPSFNIMLSAEAQTLIANDIEDNRQPQSGDASRGDRALSEQDIEEKAKASIMVDGRVLFKVGSITSFSATQRADIANTELERTLRKTPPDVPIRLNVNTQGELTTIWISDRLLLTMTEGDFMLGDDPQAQAKEWVALLNQALRQAQRERTPAYRQRAAITCGVLLALAIALHLAVRWLYRKLRRKIAQRSDDKTCWLSHWSVRGILQPALSYARLAVWIGAVFYFTGLFPITRYWRYRLVNFLQNTFASPVFTLGDQQYSILDFGRAGILIIGLWIIVRAVTALVRSRFLRNVGASREVQDAIALTLQLLLSGIGLIVILSGLGFDISSLTIFASVLGVGIGFGLQNIANNFMSGLIILFERPIRAGDFVKVGDLTGTVERIGARSTEIRTLDLVTIIVPNSELIQTKVVNWSHGHPVSRLHIPFGVAYGSDIRKMRSVVLEAVYIHPEVLRYPQPQIRFEDLGDSSLNFDVLVWIRDPRQQFRIRSDLYYLLEANFRRYDIDVPFPQQDLHIRWPSGDIPHNLQTLLLKNGNAITQNPSEQRIVPHHKSHTIINTAASPNDSAPQADLDVLLEEKIGYADAPDSAIPNGPNPSHESFQNPKSKIQNPPTPNPSREGDRTSQNPDRLLSELLDYSILVRQSGDLSDDELHQLVDEMRKEGGVDIGDRRYGLHVYDRCFVGSEAVTWIAKHQKATRDEAIRIGQLLIERGLVHHVTDEHTFEDEYLFYRFYSDEQRIVNYE